MHQIHDEHSHRDLEAAETPLDAAGQSLADALRASFGILKWIMFVLVVLYLFSNVRSIQSHEQALRLRLGRLLPGVKEAGLVWSFPYPIDEIVPLPTRRSNDLLVKSHTFHRNPAEVGKPLSFLHRGPMKGLHPVLDGALLTADAGLVHVRWKVTYKIDHVSDYVREIVGDQVEAAEELIRVYVETVGIEIATELTAEEIIRTRVEYVQSEMRRRVNDRLGAINSGVVVTLIEMNEPTPPLQVRDAFDRTQQAENAKQQRISEAQQKQTEILSEAAGAAHQALRDLLDEIDVATQRGLPLDDLNAELNRMLADDVEGTAGRLIKDAGAYYSVVVGRMQSDVELYRTLLPEYERNPHLLIARLWEQTKQAIFAQPGVRKIYRPEGCSIRLHIPLDAEEERVRERTRLQEEEFDVGKVNRGPLVPLFDELR